MSNHAGNLMVQVSAVPGLPLVSRRTLFTALPFAFLWLILINQLRLLWDGSEQYSYGWVMPLLSLGLLLRRWGGEERCSAPTELPLPAQRIKQSPASGPHPPLWDRMLPWVFTFGALLLFPLRLVLESNPDWRSLNWLLAGDVTGLTLLAIYRCRGSAWTRHLAFPVCFMLLAVPWPYTVEVPLIQSLTRANVATTIECLGWFGVPASQHGNLIEISIGMVGVNEACSGIRSFQSSLMLSLFLGEFFRLSWWRRFGLSLAGVALAFLFNVCRTSLMVALAAHQGLAAVERWHDTASLSISLACLVGLWVLGLLLKKSRRQTPERPNERPVRAAEPGCRSGSLPMRFALLLLAWLGLVEVSVEAWYRAHELSDDGQPEWVLDWPPTAPGFQEFSVPQTARQILKYDEGHWGTWSASGSLHWSIYYFRWRPAKTALAAARSHSPDVCLPAAGKTLCSSSGTNCPLAIHSLVFPFRRYEYEENGQPVYVFHCLWEEHAPGRYFEAVSSGSPVRLNLMAVVHGRRNRGQRSLEIVVAGLEDPIAAERAVLLQLEQFIRVTPPSTPMARWLAGGRKVLGAAKTGKPVETLQYSEVVPKERAAPRSRATALPGSRH